ALRSLLLPGLAIMVLWPRRQASVGGRERIEPREPTLRRQVRQRDNRRHAPLRRWPLWMWAPVWLLRYMPWLVVAGLIPLLLYLYLPLRSAQQPLLNWGSPSTWGDFWRHVTLWQSRVLVGQQLPGSLPSYIARSTELAVRQL